MEKDLARNHGKFHSGNGDLVGGYCNEILSAFYNFLDTSFKIIFEILLNILNH